MKRPLFGLVLVSTVWLAGYDANAQNPQPEAEPDIEHREMETYPDALLASIEQRDRTIRDALESGQVAGSESFLIISSKWPQNREITVAFLDGDKSLHEKIDKAAQEWCNHCNLKLDFGRDAASGEYRRWTTGDTSHKADIRISFDLPGYWSLVGNDSINPLIGGPGDNAGGRPNQRSMNFGKFKEALPPDFAGTVLHEFGHAIAFQHEHQHATEGCQADFRWSDDPGYVPTRDNLGQFKQDDEGRRPGIYTVLGGPPNKWPRAKVDHNLRQIQPSSAFEAGPFDRLSIMKYHFPAWMFVGGSQSRCFSFTPNNVLSAQDKLGVWMAYPKEGEPPAAGGAETTVEVPTDDGANRAAALELQRQHAVRELVKADPAAKAEAKEYYQKLQ
jgi:hypothetical protein